MNNFAGTLFSDEIFEIATVEPKDVKKHVVVKFGKLDWFITEKPLEIKVGDNKIKVSMYEFMQAFKDMLDTGVFEMDQIDSEVWDIENKLEVLSNQNDYLNETLREIRGGF